MDYINICLSTFSEIYFVLFYNKLNKKKNDNPMTVIATYNQSI